MSRMRNAKTRFRQLLEAPDWRAHLPEVAGEGLSAVGPLLSFLLLSPCLRHRAAVALGAVVRAAWQFSLYMLCYVALWLACDLLGEAIFLFEGQMGWPILFAASMVGGILSLRTRRAYACLTGMFVAVCGFLAVTRLDMF